MQFNYLFMYTRVASLALATNSNSKKEIVKDIDDLKVLKSQVNIYTFRTYPWAFWIFASIILSIAFYLTYIVFCISRKEDNRFLLTFAALVLYYIAFMIIYAGKIESMTIDKKKGIISHQTFNCFLSKTEKQNMIDELLDVEILYKGKIRYGGDYTRYYIRLTFRDQETLIFGETLSFFKAQYKYRKIIALIKGIVIPDIINKSFVTNETIDETIPLIT